MLSICINARSQLLPPVDDGRINSVLLQTVPDTVHTTFIHSLLHNTSDLIIHLIQVWAG